MGTLGAFSIRDALPQDAAALISLRKTIFGETNFMLYAPSEYSASPEDLSAQLAKIRDSGHSRSLLAEIEGALIGFLGVMGSPVPRLRHSAQVVLGMLRSQWRRGVGGALRRRRAYMIDGVPVDDQLMAYVFEA